MIPTASGYFCLFLPVSLLGNDGVMNAVNTKLFVQAVTRFLAGLLIVGLLLFLPAGTFAFWQAWLLIFILFVPMFIAGCRDICLLAGMAADLYSFCPHVHCGTDFDEKKS